MSTLRDWAHGDGQPRQILFHGVLPSVEHIVVALNLDLLFISIAIEDSDAIATGQISGLEPEVLVVYGVPEEIPDRALVTDYADLYRHPVLRMASKRLGVASCRRRGDWEAEASQAAVVADIPKAHTQLEALSHDGEAPLRVAPEHVHHLLIGSQAPWPGHQRPKLMDIHSTPFTLEVLGDADPPLFLEMFNRRSPGQHRRW
mmetsp:Transcript_26655/g.64367  ORF Transcript_26655/g.64367 Transcript_26655/m.64367 type:complete len:202 (+) Transcript_26655:265-870(+)